jgi:hypothetical protein
MMLGDDDGSDNDDDACGFEGNFNDNAASD